ncbi:MAG TPA: MFS transporter [Pseudonocardiaceae bacterium]|nr:MFS transporter [Pseudonocardiaceae bacterium]
MSTERPDVGLTRSRPRETDFKPGLALLLIGVAQLMVYLDTTIVNVALPHIQGALGFSGTGLEWVVNAYSVSFGGLLLLGGRFGDRFGRRTVFFVGVVVFATASLAGGLATSQAWLLAARAIQGAGAAIIAPTALSLVSTTFPEGRRRNRAMAVYSGATAVGGVVGLIAGGFLVSYLSWRGVLFVNVPIGLGLALGVRRAFPAPIRLRGRFDIPGAVTGTCGIAALVYGLSNAAGSVSGAANWGDAKISVPLGSAVALLIAFVVIEVRSREPLLPLRLFRDRNRSGAYLIMLCIGTAFYGMFFFLTIFLQDVWGYSALQTAAAYLPMLCTLLALSGACAALMPGTGPRPLLVTGAVVTAGGMLWISRITEHGNYFQGLLAPMMVAAVGLGMIFVPMNLVAVARVKAADSGVASSVLNAGEQVGGSIGLAVLGTVAWTVVANSIRGQLTAAPGPVTSQVYDQALVAGFARAFEIASCVVLLAGIIAAVFIRVTRDDKAGYSLPADD